MPRRPVNPRDRQRVIQACDSCRISKKRCDGRLPCNVCIKKNNDASCHYKAGRRECPTSRNNTNDVLTPNLQVAPENRRNVGGILSPNSSWSVREPSSEPLENPGNFSSSAAGQQLSSSGLDDDTRSSGDEQTQQPPVMLSSTSGEKVFIGNTASISFLGYLQKTLERYGTPSAFTEAQESKRFFEADTTEIGSTKLYDRLQMNEKQVLTRYFLDSSSGLFDLYSPEEALQLLDAHEAMKSSEEPDHFRRLNNLEQASLFLMIAIGAQCHGPDQDDVVEAAGLFSYARNMALEKMLENPSLELVRVFLLMAFYMLGACRRNAAFMYLGVAANAADILGLHTSAHSSYVSSAARSTRLRVAKSLRVFDVVCHSILGRASNALPLRPGRTSYVDNDNTVSSEVLYKALALGASYEMAATLQIAVSKSAEGELSTEDAENLVLKLQQCIRSVPSILKQPIIENNSDMRHVILGNLHVSGLYYFSVILITRHSLIQHVVPQLAKQSQVPSKPHDINVELTHDTTESNKIAHLAEACVEAATFMAQMCYQIMRSGHLMANMCIVKAWIFATGLVLGFSLLVEKDKSSLEKRAAFLRSLHVLGELKRLSPQAEQYYIILSSFHAAIKNYKEKQRRGTRVVQSRLVDRVFVSDVVSPEDETELISTRLPSPQMSAQDNISAQDNTLVEWRDEMPLEPADGMMPIDPAVFGDNEIITWMLWESGSHAMDYANSTIPMTDMSLDPSMTSLHDAIA